MQPLIKHRKIIVTHIPEEDLIITKEDSYVVMPTLDDELVFTISVKYDDLVDPKIVYDNTEHALLYRSDTEVVILDFLHPKVQQKLEYVGKVYIVEIDYKLKKIANDYELPVEIVHDYDFDIQKYLK